MGGMDAKVVDHPEAGRYEIRISGTLAGFAEYRRDAGVVSFTHTEVRPEFEGRGVGSTLAREVLTASRAKGDAVLPFCPFIRAYIDDHREYVDLVPAAQRRRFGLDADEAPVTTRDDG